MDLLISTRSLHGMGWALRLQNRIVCDVAYPKTSRRPPTWREQMISPVASRGFISSDLSSSSLIHALPILAPCRSL